MKPLKMLKMSLLICGLSVSLFACSSDDENETAPGTDTSDGDVEQSEGVEGEMDAEEPAPVITEGTMSFVTYNAGFAVGYVDHVEARLPEVIAALKNDVTADVICMQEVWSDDQVQAIIDGVEDVYAHSFWEKTTEGKGGSGGDSGCTAEESAPLETCVRAACDGVANDDLFGCVSTNCGDELGAVSGGCTACLAANLGKSLDEMLAACVDAEGGGDWAYEGRNGVLLLSKHALSDTSHYLFTSYLNTRVALHAKIEGAPFSVVDLYCTHLTADLSEVTYGGTLTSWGNEQGKQVDEMVAWIAETKTPGSIPVVMGDMNCGPEGTGITAEHADNFAKFEAAGMVVPYANMDAAPCSWCSDNPLVGGGPDNIIDHVMFKGSPDSVIFTAERVMDGMITIGTPGVNVDGDADGEGETAEAMLETRLSDHYGVKVTATK